ncbi:MAG TPA: hypothetical protein VGV88_02195 [Candidatus Dormibacteraeota bacterium]|nr:hypothetical protein [Candidatus Dormibacteraeota bacterium]
MKAFIRSVITIALMAGLMFGATLAVVGAVSSSGSPTTNVVLPMPTPDPNAQAAPCPNPQAVC